MRNRFSEFKYKPDLVKLWQECDFVFDANVLLDLYYNKKVYTNFVNILENKVPDRIWMPYQVGLEYHINRVDGVKKISNDYDNFINGIQSLKGVKTIYDKLNEAHGIDLGKYMDLEEISETLTEIEEYSKDLNTKIEENPNFLADDEIMNKLHETFEGKTGEQYTDSELNKIYKEGKIRNENKIPPSFKDKGYGDLVLWKQIIDHALECDKSIIFVTGDSKKDWWLTSNNDPLCPHPTLIKEFLENVNKDFYMYKLSDFLRESKTYLDTEIENKTIEIAEGIEIMRESADTLASIDTGYFEQVAETQRVMSELARSVNIPQSYFEQVAETQRVMSELARSVNIPPIFSKRLSKGKNPQADPENETDNKNDEPENDENN